MTLDRDHGHILAPMMQRGAAMEEEPDDEDPRLVTARWTLQGGEPPESNGKN